MKLTPNEIRLTIYALRNTIVQFPGKDDFYPEDWVRERTEQADIRKLLKKLEQTPPQKG